MTTSAGSGYNDNVKCLRKKVVRMQYRQETALGGIKTGGCSKKFKIIRFPLRSDPLLTVTTVEEASFSYTFHQKICAPFKPTFEYQTDRFRNPLKKLKPGASPCESFQEIPQPPPFKIKMNRLVASNKMLTMSFYFWPKM